MSTPPPLVRYVTTLLGEVERLRCDRDGARDALKRVRDRYDAARAEVERLRPVVDAATNWVENRRGWIEDDPEGRAHEEDLALIDAVDGMPDGCDCEAYDCAGECCGIGRCSCTPAPGDPHPRGEGPAPEDALMAALYGRRSDVLDAEGGGPDAV
jgi:hypothetical protein